MRITTDNSCTFSVVPQEAMHTVNIEYVVLINHNNIKHALYFQSYH